MRWLKYYLASLPVLFCLSYFVTDAVAQGIKLPPPGNVSGDPKGQKPPEVRLDQMEMTPHLVMDVDRAKAAGEDVVDWSVAITDAPAAWKSGITGKGVTVAVLDTGIDPTHQDLKDAIKAAKDFTNSRNGSRDVVGHGTHCAGSIGARKNGWGVQGIAYECSLLNGKVLGDSGRGGVDGIAAGIEWAVEQNADVISMSLGGGGTDGYIPPALAKAKAAGVIVVCAAGNDGNGSPVNYPAAYEYPIAVSAIDRTFKLADFSCTGSKVEVCGPGVQVRSTYPGDRFADLSGTSMATPNVAGVAALWVQANPKVAKADRPAKFREWLVSGCKDLGSPGRDTSFGWGLPLGSKLDSPVTPPPPPPVTPVPPGSGLELTEADLSEAGKKKLADAGLEKFSITLTPKKVAEAPAIGEEELQKRVLNGETLVIGFGLKPDVSKYPGALAATFLPPGVEPGVYKVSRSVSILLEKLE